MKKDRVYTPADAVPSQLKAMLATLGLQRVVLVQASVYGTDNRCLVDGLNILGGMARGVAVISPGITENELKDLHVAGVRGVRINIASGHDRPIVEIASEMRILAERISSLGWHLQLFVRPHFLSDLEDIVSDIATDIVIDHMGLVPADDYQKNPHFSSLLSMLDSGRVWVKVSGAYRVGDEKEAWGNVSPMARALIKHRQDRIIWGSDWPHPPEHGHDAIDHETVMPFRPLDTGLLLNLLEDWAADPEILKTILVNNPARLYGFN
jgi:predicted TIM-barrel fold metal-dependent hydrolase